MSIFKPNLNSNSFPSKKRKFLASKYDDMYVYRSIVSDKHKHKKTKF